jgi:alpha-tubulin suppressor-like RCC1 family protein
MRKITFLILTTLFPLLIYSQCWKNVSTGGAHTLGLGADNSLWAWGRGNVGQLGLGSFTNVNLPTKVGTDLNWTQISCGNAHSMALKSDGTIWTWGRNLLGQLGNGSSGNLAFPTQMGTLNNWVFICAGDEYSTAIKSDGTLWAWGDNTYGQLGDGTFGSTENKSIPVQVGTDTNWLSVSAGNNHTMAIKTNGTLWTFGRNNSGQLGDGTNIDKITPVQIGTDTNWQTVSASLYHTVALKNNGSLWTWGLNTNGQLGDGTNVDKNAPINIDPTLTFTKIARGIQHIISERSNGTLWSNGLNVSGQLGDATVIAKSLPTAVNTVVNSWKTITSRFSHCAGIKTDGTMFMWGSNLYGQLGNGSSAAAVSSPVSIICPTLASNNFNLNIGFSIYPNPTNDKINIELSDDLEISKIVITDITGKIVLDQNENLKTINVEDLSNGLYIIQLFSDQKIFQGKFVKK